MGEPSGVPPNAYGNSIRHQITLPASGLKINISDVYWQNSLPLDDRKWIYPDIPVRLSYDDYVAGRDPVMRAIMKYDPDEAPEWLYRSPYGSWNRPSQKSRWEIVVEK